MATAKDPYSNIYLKANSYTFLEKVTKVGWIIFLPAWVMGKNPQGWCWTLPPPPGRTGLKNSYKDRSHLLNFRAIVAIVPQLSKCLKFDTIWGVLNWSNDLNLNKDITRPMHVLLLTEWSVIITWLTDIIWRYLLWSFVKLMMIESLKSFT